MKSVCSMLALCLIFGCLSVLAVPTLTVSREVLTPTQRDVTLTWSGIENPTTYDFIGVYNPYNSSSVQDYMGWIYLSSCPTYTKGYGDVYIPALVNMRAPYVFKLFTCTDPSNKCQTMQSVAMSSPVSFENPIAPAQGHLAFTSDPATLSFIWVSGDNSSTPNVQYGLSADSLDTTVTGTTTTYGRSEMCDAPANSTLVWKDPGFIHTAFLGPLQPTTQYFYKFGSENSGWSDTFMFISPQPQSIDEEIFVVAYGDMGVLVPFNIVNDEQPPSVQTTAWVTKLINTSGSTSPFAKYSKKYGQSNQPLPWSLLHIGDISYARGYGFLWDYFFDLIQPVASQIPYMVCIGNHEYDYIGMPWRANDGYGNDSGGECGVPYNLRFLMPGTSSALTRNLWYSYNQGPVHFVYMSTEHNFLPGSEQYDWILKDLSSVDRSQTPWIVFSGHRPAYSSSTKTTNETIMLQDIYEPVFVKFKVNLCLWGHVHAYERTCGIVNSTCVDNDAAPVHIVIGMAGNIFQVPWYEADEHNGDGHAYQPDWSIFRTENYGYSRFFANSTHFLFQFVGDQRGQVHDEVWLTPISMY